MMESPAENRKTTAVLLHELSQPLNTITLSCNNIQNRAKIEEAGLSSDYIIGKMETLLEAATKAAQIIEDLKRACTDGEAA